MISPTRGREGAFEDSTALPSQEIFTTSDIVVDLYEIERIQRFKHIALNDNPAVRRNPANQQILFNDAMLFFMKWFPLDFQFACSFQNGRQLLNVYYGIAGSSIPKKVYTGIALFEKIPEEMKTDLFRALVAQSVNPPAVLPPTQLVLCQCSRSDEDGFLSRSLCSFCGQSIRFNSIPSLGTPAQALSYVCPDSDPEAAISH